MPDNRVQGIVGGFAAGTRAGIDSRSLDVKEAEAKVQQRNQLRKEADDGVVLALKSMKEAASKASTAYFSELEESGRQTIKDVHTRTAQELWKSTQQMLELGKQQGLYTDAEIANVKEQFRIGASLNNPSAESKLIAAGEAEAKVQPAVDKAQQLTDTSAKFVNFIKPGGEGNQPIRKSAREGSADAAALSQQGFIRDKRSELVTGAPGDFEGTDSQRFKAVQELAESRIVTTNFDSGLSQIQDFIRSDNYVGGITGSTLQLINSAAQQFAQLTGTETLFNDEELNINAIDENLSDENIGFLRRAAISGDVREGAKARLAYILAKQLDPNGRISNADVDNAEKILSGSADRQSTLLSLQNLRDTSRREFNTRARIMEETLKGTADPFRKIGKSSGLGGDKAVGDLSDEELLQLLK